ncbi:MAG: hypothetical protein JXQ75_07155 [Phycisphaerae bacterium]|nr:hypothetical protein [Phycisphaerae bacterium]
MANSEWRIARHAWRISGGRRSCNTGVARAYGVENHVLATRHLPFAVRRSAFTLVEMMLAATITAMTAIAATTLIFAIGQASTETRDIRNTKTTGHYALSRIAQKIRSARGIGEVTTTAVTLWAEDANEDDVLNLNELAVIKYDGTNHRVTYEHLSESADTTVVDQDDFTDVDEVDALMATVPEKEMVIWAEGIESLTFDGYPADTETRIVETRFTIGTGSDEVVFQTTASPKASGDYLFLPEAQAAPLPGSSRIRRLHFSRWDGFSDL